MKCLILSVRRRRTKSIAYVCRALVFVTLGVAIACKGIEPELPAGTSDPNLVKTWPKAIAALNGARQTAQRAFALYTTTSGLLTDELREWHPTNPNSIDARIPGNNYVHAYSSLHAVRNSALQAIGLFRDTGPDSSMVYRAELYALYGYAEVMLAELFCSGIPLSTVDYDSDYTLTRGFTTDEVFQHAIALFDTAIALAGTDTVIAPLPRIGKARAYLGLGKVDSAASVVASVPDGYRYALTISLWPNPASNSQGFTLNLADQQGENGLPFVSAEDPRITWRAIVRSSTVTNYLPLKYFPAGNDQGTGATLVIASGIEARLTEAESALRKGDTAGWIGKINMLRRTQVTPIMADTTVPATLNQQVDLHFYERAFWLFMTGHRQGDLRRLARFDQRPVNTLYPIGNFITGIDYGDVVVAEVPPQELLNANYQGCFHYDP